MALSLMVLICRHTPYLGFWSASTSLSVGDGRLSNTNCQRAISYDQGGYLLLHCVRDISRPLHCPGLSRAAPVQHFAGLDRCRVSACCEIFLALNDLSVGVHAKV